MLNGTTIQCFSAELMHMLWFNFILGLIYFSLCLGMVMYDNEFETKENKI